MVKTYKTSPKPKLTPDEILLEPKVLAWKKELQKDYPNLPEEWITMAVVYEFNNPGKLGHDKPLTGSEKRALARSSPQQAGGTRSSGSGTQTAPKQDNIVPDAVKIYSSADEAPHVEPINELPSIVEEPESVIVEEVSSETV